ncbi:hypothetical protein [Bhargavaea cecembensis]|uniref:hypothetical protein n=1 Tax=Bhargavaea cecembensis TaxID=394098 RepID=UPI00058C137D|nr:hypothetical protein [Bhargavaea cecembensis]
MGWNIHQLVLGVHILFGIMWVGGILFVGWGVFPAMKRLDFASQQQFLQALMGWTHRLLSLIGAAVIVTGVALGTAFGPVREWSTLWNTSYGQHFILAFGLGLATLGWGALVSYRYSMKVIRDGTLWGLAGQGYPMFLNRALRRVTAVSGVEVLGFIALLAVMLSF